MKTSKLLVTGLCGGNSPGSGEFPAQRASNAENASIWWRHHVFTVPESVGCNFHAHHRFWHGELDCYEWVIVTGLCFCTGCRVSIYGVWTWNTFVSWAALPYSNRAWETYGEMRHAYYWSYTSQAWKSCWETRTPNHRITGRIPMAWKTYGETGPPINILRPRQNGHHFPNDISKHIFLNENVWISMNISLKFVAECKINNIPSLVQIMAWRRRGDKPLSETMLVYFNDAYMSQQPCSSRPSVTCGEPGPDIGNLAMFQPGMRNM